MEDTPISMTPELSPTPESDHGRIRVAVIGGGIAGLTAAAELSTRGFAVTVFEARKPEPGLQYAALGGKARSWWGDASGKFAELPAEHGFRFFPGFYRHVIDTMEQIPATPTSTAAGGASVADQLVDLDLVVLLSDGGHALEFPLPTRSHVPTWRERRNAVKGFRGALPSVREVAAFLAALARLATSCERRQFEWLEHQSWLQYVNPGWGVQRSEAYQRLFSKGLTRTFVATRAEEMSARTGGMILLQLIYDMFGRSPGRRAADRVLNGPTSEVWFKPWYEQLRSRAANPVSFEFDMSALKVELVPGGDRVARVGFRPSGVKLSYLEEPGEWRDEFDCYVLAIPCEAVKKLVADSKDPAGGAIHLAARAEPLRRAFNLRTAWMSGLVFGCTERLPLPRAHILCLDSEWALTLLDQAQVWSSNHLDHSPLGTPVPYKTLISVDVSDWASPGPRSVPAQWALPREAIAERVWEQLRRHVPLLPASMCDHHVLDPGIKLFGGSQFLISLGSEEARASQFITLGLPRSERAAGAGPVPGGEAELRTNAEPLLINTPGSWENRPRPVLPTISNLFLAGDYVQTCTDFASMEAADEAAKRAVNAILDKFHHNPDDRCELYKLEHPQAAWFRIPRELAERVDEKVAFPLGLRAPFRLPILVWMVGALMSWLRGWTRRP